ncbi:MAG TPA: V-type ATP synthase subunit E family protein [Clostridia bacterium]|nr:V-type ATP synthase subunit E family protein [Clostridia bacterium]
MAVSVEDKIELFSKMIFKDIEELSSDKRLKAVESFEKEKNRLLEEAEAKKRVILEEAEKRAEKDKKQLIAKAKSQVYHQLLDKRQQLISEITELLVQEAKSFVSEEDYKGYLSRSFIKAATAFEKSDSLQLYFTKRDLEVLKEFINQQISSGELKGRCMLQEAGQSIIGGFYAEDDKREIQVDYTLKSLIEENRELIGSSVSLRLDEVQDNGK